MKGFAKNLIQNGVRSRRHMLLTICLARCLALRSQKFDLRSIVLQFLSLVAISEDTLAFLIFLFHASAHPTLVLFSFFFPYCIQIQIPSISELGTMIVFLFNGYYWQTALCHDYRRYSTGNHSETRLPEIVPFAFTISYKISVNSVRSP